jgi:hypothetical protein
MFDMKKVTLRRESRLLDSAPARETRFGKPYVRVLPGRTKSFLGAAGHLGIKTPMSSEAIPHAEWKGIF